MTGEILLYALNEK